MRSVRRILILGMGRSGTSFLAEYLKLCGVFVGDLNWAHEHKEMRRINDLFFAQAFGARAGVKPYGKIPDNPIEIASEWHRHGQALVEHMDQQTLAAGAHYWMMKDPRATILRDLWLPHADVVVGIFRNPHQVVASYLARKWIRGWRKRAVAVGYWRRFNQELLRAAQSHTTGPFFILNFNGDVTAQCETLCERLDIQTTEPARKLFSPSEIHYTGEDTMNADCRLLYDKLLKNTISTKRAG